MSTHILGVPASLPLYFTATALAKLAHAEGEVAIVKALSKQGSRIDVWAGCKEGWRALHAANTELLHVG